MTRIVEVQTPAYITKAGLPAADVTSHGTVFRPLSPFLLGPVPLYDGMWSRTMENAWQYSKVYPGHLQRGAQPWWDWARAGWASSWATRYPMGPSARPLHSVWAGQELDYVTARRRIYIPLYSWAVRFYQLDLFTLLRGIGDDSGRLILQDFDAYDHRSLGYSWEDVINDPDRKMGHGFVLAMMIEGYL